MRLHCVEEKKKKTFQQILGRLCRIQRKSFNVPIREKNKNNVVWDRNKTLVHPADSAVCVAAKPSGKGLEGVYGPSVALPLGCRLNPG